MSYEDERVVKLSLDDSDFKKQAKKNRKTLQQYKEDTDFTDVEQANQDAYAQTEESLLNYMKAFGTMSAFVQTKINQLKYSIRNFAYSTGKYLLTGAAKEGWSKYAEKTTAVATLMGQSLKDASGNLLDDSNKMEYINTQLEKLNWYTDETSYTFTDMVSNIGKFTAAGQDLETSVTAMMGIANWAAKCGQNAQSASRAMYNLAQALSAGYVKLIDWRSIQNANMDTTEFREQALATAVAMKKLTKDTNGYYKTLKGNQFKITQFTEYLSDGWFTSEVLMDTLNKYSSVSTEVYERVQSSGKTTSEVISEIEEETEKLGETAEATAKLFAIKSFKAAQEAKTFADAITSVKEALGSKWSQSWEYMFGSYDTSKGLWTELSNRLYDLVVEGGNARNDMLKIWSGVADLTTEDTYLVGYDISKWLNTGVKDIQNAADKLENTFSGRSLLYGEAEYDEYGRLVKTQGALWDIADAVSTLKSAIGEGILNLFPETETENIKKTKKQLEQLQATYDNMDEMTKQSSFGQKLASEIETVQYNLQTLQKASRLQWITEKIKAFAVSVKNFFDNNKETITAITKAIANLGRLIFKVAGFIAKLISAISKGLTPVYEALSRFMKTLSGSVADATGAMADASSGLTNFEKITNVVTKLANVLAKGIDYLTAAIGKYKEKVGDTTSQLVDKDAPLIVRIFQTVWAVIKSIFSSGGDIIKKGIGSLGSILKNTYTKVTDYFNKKKTTDTNDTSDTNTQVKKAYDPLIKGTEMDESNDNADELQSQSNTFLGKIKSIFKSIGNGLKNIYNKITPVISKWCTKIKEFFSNIGKKFKEWFSFGKSTDATTLSSSISGGSNSLGGQFATINSAVAAFDKENASGAAALEKGANTVNSITGGLSSFKSAIDSFNKKIGESLKAFAAWVKNNEALCNMLMKILTGIIILIGIGMTFSLLKKTVLKPFTELGKLFGTIGKAITNISESVRKIAKAQAFNLRAKGIAYIATSLTLFAASISLIAYTFYYISSKITLYQIDQMKRVANIMTQMILVIAAAFVMIVAAITVLEVIISKSRKIASGFAGKVQKILGEITSGINLMAKFIGIGAAILSIASAISLIAKAFVMLSQLDDEAINRGAKTILFIGFSITTMISMLILAASLSPFSKNIKYVLRATAGIILLIAQLQKLGDFPITKYISAIYKLQLLFNALASLYQGIGGWSTPFGKNVKYILNASIGLLVLIKVLQKLNNYNYSQLVDAIYKIQLIFSALGNLFAAATLGIFAKAALRSLPKVGIGLLLLVASLKILQSVDDQTITKLIKILNRLILMMSVLGIVGKYAGSNSIKQAAKSIKTVAISLAVIAGVFGIITLLFSNDQINTMLKMISIIGSIMIAVMAIIAVIVAFCTLSKKQQKQIQTKTIVALFLIIAGVVGLMSVILYTIVVLAKSGSLNAGVDAFKSISITLIVVMSGMAGIILITLIMIALLTKQFSKLDDAQIKKVKTGLIITALVLVTIIAAVGLTISMIMLSVGVVSKSCGLGISAITIITAMIGIIMVLMLGFIVVVMQYAKKLADESEKVKTINSILTTISILLAAVLIGMAALVASIAYAASYIQNGFDVAAIAIISVLVVVLMAAIIVFVKLIFKQTSELLDGVDGGSNIKSVAAVFAAVSAFILAIMGGIAVMMIAISYAASLITTSDSAKAVAILSIIAAVIVAIVGVIVYAILKQIMNASKEVSVSSMQAVSKLLTSIAVMMSIIFAAIIVLFYALAGAASIVTMTNSTGAMLIISIVVAVLLAIVAGIIFTIVKYLNNIGSSKANTIKKVLSSINVLLITIFAGIILIITALASAAVVISMFSSIAVLNAIMNAVTAVLGFVVLIIAEVIIACKLLADDMNNDMVKFITALAVLLGVLFAGISMVIMAFAVGAMLIQGDDGRENVKTLLGAVESILGSVVIILGVVALVGVLSGDAASMTKIILAFSVIIGTFMLSIAAIVLALAYGAGVLMQGDDARENVKAIASVLTTIVAELVIILGVVLAASIVAKTGLGTIAAFAIVIGVVMVGLIGIILVLGYTANQMKGDDSRENMKTIVSLVSVIMVELIVILGIVLAAAIVAVAGLGTVAAFAIVIGAVMVGLMGIILVLGYAAKQMDGDNARENMKTIVTLVSVIMVELIAILGVVLAAAIVAIAGFGTVAAFAIVIGVIMLGLMGIIYMLAYYASIANSTSTENITLLVSVISIILTSLMGILGIVMAAAIIAKGGTAVILALTAAMGVIFAGLTLVLLAMAYCLSVFRSDIDASVLYDMFNVLINTMNKLFSLALKMTLLSWVAPKFYELVSIMLSLSNAVYQIGWGMSQAAASLEKLESFDMLSFMDTMADWKEGINALTAVVMDINKAMQQTDAYDKIGSSVDKLLDAYRDSMHKSFTVDEFKEYGKYIIDGINTGIDEQKSKVFENIYNFDKYLQDVIRQDWGIESPSKITTAMGGYIMQGLSNGISDETQATVSQVQASTNSVATAFTAAVSSITTDLSDEDNGLTIRPIIDLSDVEAGASTIDNMLSDRTYNMDAQANIAETNAKLYNANQAANVKLQQEKLSALSRAADVAANAQTDNSTNNYTFNVTGDNPEEIAEEVSKLIQKQINRRKAKYA